MTAEPLAGWRAQIEAELAEAQQAQTDAIAKAAEALTAAEAQRARHRTATEGLAQLPSDTRLSRPLSGRLAGLLSACEGSDREALFCRRGVDAAAERVRMLQEALAQLDVLLAPEAAEAETEAPRAPALRLAS